MSEKQYWLIASMALVFAIFIYLLHPILSPFLMSFIVAYLATPLVNVFTRYNLSNTVAVTIVFLILGLIALLFIILIIPTIVSQIKAFILILPDLGDWIKNQLVPYLSDVLPDNSDLFNWHDLSRQLSADWKNIHGLLGKVTHSISASSLAFFQFFLNLFLTVVVSFYLMRDWGKLDENLRALLPRSIEPTVVSVIKECDVVLSAFLKGQLMVMLWLGFIYGLGLWLIDLPFAILIGFISGLVSIVPYMGFLVGISIALITAFFQFGASFILLGVIVVFIIGQMLESMLLTPVLVGNKIGLHPVAVIFAIMAGGQLFGFTGILLALPIASVVMVILMRLHNNYRKSALYQ